MSAAAAGLWFSQGWQTFRSLSPFLASGCSCGSTTRPIPTRPSPKPRMKRSATSFFIRCPSACAAFCSLLVGFFVGMLSDRRGNELVIVLAMILAFLTVSILCGLPNKVDEIFGGQLYERPDGLPVVEFPWWSFVGTLVTFSDGVLVR